MEKDANVAGKARRGASGKAVAKVSVSLGAAALAGARAVAKRRGQSLSAYMTEALERDQRRVALAEFIADYESRFGVISEREVAEAKAKWRG